MFLPQRVVYTHTMDSSFSFEKLSKSTWTAARQIHSAMLWGGEKFFSALYEPPRHLPNKFSRCPFSFMALRKYIK